MNHCNQPNVPILSKFRGDDNLSASAMVQKYNGHGNSNSNVSANPYQSNVPAYTSSHLHSNNDDKQRLTNSYQQSNTSNSQGHQSQPELTPDLCSALLNQQTDAKRGMCSIHFLLLFSNLSTLIHFIKFSAAKCEFWLAIFDTEFSCCWLFITFTGQLVIASLS